MASKHPSDTDEVPEKFLPSLVRKQNDLMRGPLASLRNRNFRYLMAGQVAHSAAFWMDVVARNWLVWGLTEGFAQRALMLTLTNLIRAVPLLALGPVGGVVADRFDRKVVLFWCQLATILVFFWMGLLVTLHVATYWNVVLPIFLGGVAIAFNNPARTSMVPELVPRPEVNNAISLLQTAQSVPQFFGPAIAGFLIPLGVEVPFYVMSGIYVFALVSTQFIQLEKAQQPQKLAASAYSHLKEGLVYVRTQRPVFLALMLSFVPMFLGMPYVSLLPIFADKVFHVGGSGLGVLNAAGGIGAILGAGMAAVVGRSQRYWPLALGSVLVFGLSLVGFGGVSILGVGLIFMFVAGATTALLRVVITSMLLENTPKEMHGRVMSMFLLNMALQPAGSIIAGSITEVLGVQFAVMLLGGACAASAPVFYVVAPRLTAGRRVEFQPAKR